MSVEENTCYICHNPVGNAHRCKKCRQYIHLFCGVSELDEESEGYVLTVECSCRCHLTYVFKYIIPVRENMDMKLCVKSKYNALV